MIKLNHIFPLFILASLVMAFSLSSCGSSSDVPKDSSTIATSEPEVLIIDGKTLLQERCTMCHTTARITSKNASLAEWTSTVDRMIGKGAQLAPAERDALIQYLVETYP